MNINMGYKTFEELEQSLEDNGIHIANIELSEDPSMWGTTEDGITVVLDAELSYIEDIITGFWYFSLVELSMKGKVVYRGMWMDNDDIKKTLKVVRMLHSI